MRISDWSSDVCSSDLGPRRFIASRCAVASSSLWPPDRNTMPGRIAGTLDFRHISVASATSSTLACSSQSLPGTTIDALRMVPSSATFCWYSASNRSEEHTSELQSLMRISYAVFCLKKKKNTNNNVLIQLSHLNTTILHYLIYNTTKH